MPDPVTTGFIIFFGLVQLLLTGAIIWQWRTGWRAAPSMFIGYWCAFLLWLIAMLVSIYVPHSLRLNIILQLAGAAFFFGSKFFSIRWYRQHRDGYQLSHTLWRNKVALQERWVRAGILIMLGMLTVMMFFMMLWMANLMFGFRFAPRSFGP